jgi:hypothetical protein
LTGPPLQGRAARDDRKGTVSVAPLLLPLLSAAGPTGVDGPAPIALAVGRALAARVIAAGGGRVELAVAGGRLVAASGLPLEPGQILRLVVERSDADRVVLRAEPGAPPPAPAADPATAGAALQVPLPGGGTAEVRVGPDGGGDGGPAGAPRPRRIAVLLTLSHLGTVVVDALAGPGGVEATVRASGEEARAFLAGRAPELVRALSGTGAPASVGVRAIAGPPPERLAQPPAACGRDFTA